MEREKQIYRVTLAGSAGNVLLVIVKFVAGVLGHSSAMIADAVHSLSDFLTDIIVLVFVGISAKPQDPSHDYGHGKFETLATLFISLGAVKFAGWLNGASLTAPGRLAFWVAILSILVKEGMYRFTVHKGRKLDSPALKANAWHHRSDALSSVAAAVGIGGALLLGGRWAVLDPLASIVVGAMLLAVAWEILRPSLGELTDASLPDEAEKEILDVIGAFPDVSEPHNLRTRRIGNRIAIEAHIRMDGTLSLQEAHDRTTDIENKLKERFGKDTLVTLHTEPTKHASL